MQPLGGAGDLGSVARPSVYMMEGQPLPYYARPDLAYLDGVYHGNSGLGLVWSIGPPSGFLQRIVFGHYAIQTGATVANRFPMLQYVDQYNATVWESVSATSIPANTLATVTFSTHITSAYSSGTSFMLPIPDTILWSGGNVFCQAQNYQADDQITQLNYYRMLIPTGPPIESEQGGTNGQIPTPLLI